MGISAILVGREPKAESGGGGLDEYPYGTLAGAPQGVQCWLSHLDCSGR